VPARWRIDEVQEATGVDLPEHDAYDTISGLILQRLGRVPRPGDTVDITLIPPGGDDEAARVRLHVVAVHRHVPSTVRIEALPDTGGPA
jgi:CBS domain containing-hemolysin-like protein